MADAELKTAAEALRAVRANGRKLRDVPEELRTEEVCRTAVRMDPAALRWTPDRIFGSLVFRGVEIPSLKTMPEAERTAEACRAAVFCRPEEMAFVPEALQDRIGREAAAVCAAAKNADGWQDVPEKLKTYEFCRAAVLIDPAGAVQFAVPPAMMAAHPDLGMEAVRRSGELLAGIPAGARTTAMCIEAVMQDASLLKEVPPALRTPEMGRAAVLSCMRVFRDGVGGGSGREWKDVVPAELKASPSLRRAQELFRSRAFLRPPENLSEDGWLLRLAPAEERTVEACRTAMMNCPLALAWTPDAVKTPEICMEAVSRDGCALAFVPDSMKAPELCMAAVRQNGGALMMVPERLKTAEICMEAVSRLGAALACVPERLKTKDMCRTAARQDGGALEWIPDALKTEDMCLAAVEQDGMRLRFVPEELKTSKVCAAAVRESCRAIACAPDMAASENVCMDAVMQNGAMLDHAPAASKTKALCIAAAVSCAEDFRRRLFAMAPEELLRSPSLRRMHRNMLAGGPADGWALGRVPEAARTEQGCRAAVESCPMALAFVPERLLSPDICLKAVSADGYALVFLPEAMKTADICEAAARQNAWAMQFVPQELRERTAEAAGIGQDEAAHPLPDGSPDMPIHLLYALDCDLRRMPECMKTQEACLEAAEKDGSMLDFAPERLATEAFLLEAVRRNGKALRHVPDGMKTEAMCLEAVGQNGLLLQSVPEALKTDAVCAKAAGQDAASLAWAPEGFRLGWKGAPAADEEGGAGCRKLCTRFAEEAAAMAEALGISELRFIRLAMDGLEGGRIRCRLESGSAGILASAVYRLRKGMHGRSADPRSALAAFAGKIERTACIPPEPRLCCAAAARRACGAPEPEIIEEPEDSVPRMRRL